MNTFVKLFDTVTITPASVDGFVETSIKDNIYIPSGKILRADIVATHAGRLTRNHGFYLPQKMREGANSLLENYGKPILTHHNSHDDPVGRVVGVKYVDTSMNFARDSVVDALIKNLCKPSLPFVQSLDLVDKLSESDLLRDPAYPGLGHILITAEISDSDAIQKILDKRYLTVSIGASTDKAICSICKQDWVEEGPCEHRPGKVYDDKLAYIIAGKLLYDEVSFVNVPADTLAGIVTIHNGAMQDSIVVEESQQICNVHANFYFTDSSVGGTSMSKVQDAWGKVSKLVALEDSKEEDKLKALKDFLEEFKEDKDACVQEAKDKLAELEPAKPPVEPTKPVDQAQDNTGDGNTGDKPDEADKHYEDMIAFGYELSLFDEDFEDAKLSTKKRKGLAKTTFCKPGSRKYPVPDCGHAKSAMAYAKKHNEASSVVACIRRKAKALGCPFNGKDDFDGWEAELDTILADLAEREAAAAKTADNQDSNTKPSTQDPAAQDDPTDDCEACKKHGESLDALRQELRDIYVEFDCAQQAHVEDVEKAKTQLADTLVVLDQLSGKKIEDLEKAKTETSALSLEDLLKKADSLKEALDMETILSKVNDGMTQVPDGKVDDPTLSSEGDQDPTVNNDEDPYKIYRDKYKKILAKDGFSTAGAYVLKLVRSRLVPYDFDPESKGGSA
jgi:hypothetical protein